MLHPIPRFRNTCPQTSPEHDTVCFLLSIHNYILKTAVDRLAKFKTNVLEKWTQTRKPRDLYVVRYLHSIRSKRTGESNRVYGPINQLPMRSRPENNNNPCAWEIVSLLEHFRGQDVHPTNLRLGMHENKAPKLHPIGKIYRVKSINVLTSLGTASCLEN
jgi:hypothetical protein